MYFPGGGINSLYILYKITHKFFIKCSQNFRGFFLNFSWRALNWGGYPMPVKQLTTTKPRFSPLFSLFSLSALTTLSSLSPSHAVFTSIHTLAYTFSLIISSSLKECSQQIFSTSLTLSTLVALAFTLHFTSLLFSSHECNKNLSREPKQFNNLAHTPEPTDHPQDTQYSILYTHHPRDIL